MGYTHYWRTLREIEPGEWEPFVELAEDAVKATGVQVAWEADYSPDSMPPDFNADHIRFNGLGEDGHETFLLSREPTDFEFCKTARKPYDLCVTAVLTLAARHLPVVVSSDGNPDDWRKASEITGEPVPDGIYYPLPHQGETK